MIPYAGHACIAKARRKNALAILSRWHEWYDPTTIDGWIARTHGVKPELDKEVMGAIFIKYKGAEAGEVDWRPTEPVPEYYYTV